LLADVIHYHKGNFLYKIRNRSYKLHQHVMAAASKSKLCITFSAITRWDHWVWFHSVMTFFRNRPYHCYMTT